MNLSQQAVFSCVVFCYWRFLEWLQWRFSRLSVTNDIGSWCPLQNTMNTGYTFHQTGNTSRTENNACVAGSTIKIKIMRLQMSEQNILLNCWSAFYISLFEGICHLFWYLLGLMSRQENVDIFFSRFLFSCQVGKVALFYLKEGIQQLISRGWYEESAQSGLLPSRAQCWRCQQPLPDGTWGTWGYGVKALV